MSEPPGPLADSREPTVKTQVGRSARRGLQQAVEMVTADALAMAMVKLHPVGYDPNGANIVSINVL